MLKLDNIQKKISGFFGSQSSLDNKEIKKSEDPTGTQLPEDSGQDKEEILASEITALLDDGTISPETEKVKNWAVSKGLSEESAEDFANQVISAYFSDEDDEEEDDMAEEDLIENKEDEDGEDEDDEDDEVVKAALNELSSLHKDQEVILKGLENLTQAMLGITQRLEKMEKQEDEVKLLKSQISQILVTPANQKSPVTHVQTPVNGDQGPNIQVIKSWVKNQFISGNPNKLTTQQVAALDSGYVSPDLLKIYNQEVKK